MAKSQVIIISGVTASGKTTLIKALHQQLTDSTILSFDDYDIDALPSTPPIDTPLTEAVNQYDISRLMTDFFKVKGHFKYILIDFPFGYKHQILKPYIDTLIYLQTPLDVCLGRQILRDYQDKTAAEIRNWIKTYLDFARPIFIDHKQYISQDADLILDGLLPLSDKVKLVLNDLNI